MLAAEREYANYLADLLRRAADRARARGRLFTET
jgi:hypothetical protein